jgi:hypothetical protein
MLMVRMALLVEAMALALAFLVIILGFMDMAAKADNSEGAA